MKCVPGASDEQDRLVIRVSKQFWKDLLFENDPVLSFFSYVNPELDEISVSQDSQLLERALAHGFTLGIRIFEANPLSHEQTHQQPGAGNPIRPSRVGSSTNGTEKPYR